MVVAQQMQHRVGYQIGEFPPLGVTVLPGLRRHPLHGEYHVPQRDKARAGVGVLRAGQLAGGQFKLREAEDVRGAVHLPQLSVDLVDAVVIRQEHVHLAGGRESLRRQRRADGPADQGAVGIVGGAGYIGGDGDVVCLSHLRFSSNRA